eukprot:ctg_181.g78
MTTTRRQYYRERVGRVVRAHNANDRSRACLSNLARKGSSQNVRKAVEAESASVRSVQNGGGVSAADRVDSEKEGRAFGAAFVFNTPCRVGEQLLRRRSLLCDRIGVVMACWRDPQKCAPSTECTSQPQERCKWLRTWAMARDAGNENTTTLRLLARLSFHVDRGAPHRSDPRGDRDIRSTDSAVGCERPATTVPGDGAGVQLGGAGSDPAAERTVEEPGAGGRRAGATVQLGCFLGTDAESLVQQLREMNPLVQVERAPAVEAVLRDGRGCYDLVCICVDAVEAEPLTAGESWRCVALADRCTAAGVPCLVGGVHGLCGALFVDIPRGTESSAASNVRAAEVSRKRPRRGARKTGNERSPSTHTVESHYAQCLASVRERLDLSRALPP